MRIRHIRPEFFKHEHISDLPPLTRLLFVALWCMADRSGRLEDRPRRIKVECLPFDDCDVDAMLWELAESWFIERYEIDGVHLIQVTAFEKHQRISGKEAMTESEFPEREEGTTREAPEKHPRTQENGVMERRRKEKGEKDKPSRVFPFIPPTLEEWQAYCATTWSDWHPSRSQEGHEYYTKVEWRIGKAKKPATDWRACASTSHKNAGEWGTLQPRMTTPTREEYFAFAAQMAERCIPFPEEPRFQWGPDRWAESYNRHDAKGWKGISDWKAILKADCQQWVAREQENRKRPAR
jgi:hypothetical protein